MFSCACNLLSADCNLLLVTQFIGHLAGTWRPRIVKLPFLAKHTAPSGHMCDSRLKNATPRTNLSLTELESSPRGNPPSMVKILSWCFHLSKNAINLGSSCLLPHNRSNSTTACTTATLPMVGKQRLQGGRVVPTVLLHKAQTTSPLQPQPPFSYCILPEK